MFLFYTQSAITVYLQLLLDAAKMFSQHLYSIFILL